MLSSLFRKFAKTIKPSFEIEDMASLMFTIPKNKPKGLKDILSCLLDNKIELTHIESRPASVTDIEKGYTFIVDVETPKNFSLDRVSAFISSICGEVKVLGSLESPWFPRKVADLDSMPQKLDDLHADHPGRNDESYLQRKRHFAEIAKSINIGDVLPSIKYELKEKETWKSLYRALTPYYKTYACTEYYNNLKEMESKELIKEEELPVIADVNRYLVDKTGFQLKPISSLESARDFLNCLAFKVFPTTLHMRHYSNPFFSIEPDYAHEILGHVPMLADSEFADFVQEIGLASLGASNEHIEQLITLYFYSVELGILMNEQEEKRVYGARVLSSFDEMEHAVSIKPELRYFDPFQACNVKYHRRHLQNIYYFCSDFKEAGSLMRRFALTMPRHFYASFDKRTMTIKVDHKVKAIAK